MRIRVVIGFDGSPAAGAAIDVGATLFPRAQAWVAHLWVPPFASTALRGRLWAGTGHVDEFVAAVEREGEREAERIAAMGVTLATAAGWDAEPVVVRSYGGEGLQLAELAEKIDPDVVVVGSRGLGGAHALLGSVSDMVVHYAPRPVLVVPHPLLAEESADLMSGPVLVGVDGDQAPEDDPTGPPPAAADVTRLRVHARPGVHGRAVGGALADCARARGAAAVVVGSRGRSAVAEVLLGSVAMATLHHSYRPVLAAPPADRVPRRESLL